MWRDICMANSSAILCGLDSLIDQLAQVRSLLEEANGERLLEWFDKAAGERRKQGYLPRARG
jgi:prephenate dehydrogenase